MRNNSHLLSRRKEGGEGISGDARRNRLTAPWIHNFFLRLVEMIAMQSYNRFGQLRVQKIRLIVFEVVIFLIIFSK